MTCNNLACTALKSDEKIQHYVDYVVEINAQVYINLGLRVVVIEADFNRHIQCNVEQQRCPNHVPGNQKFVCWEQNAFLFPIFFLFFLFFD